MAWKGFRWIGLGVMAAPWAIAQTASFPPLEPASPAPSASSSETPTSIAAPLPSVAVPAASSSAAPARSRRPPDRVRPRLRCAPGSARAPEACHAITLGYRLGVGLTGARRSQVPSESVGVGVEVPLYRGLRYQGGLAFHALKSWYGALLGPLSLGYLVPVLDRPGLHARVEPGVDLLVVEELFTRDGHAALIGAGAWVRAAAYWGPWLLGLSPLGVHLRYLYLSGSRPNTHGILEPGLDWVFRVDLGRQFP